MKLTLIKKVRSILLRPLKTITILLWKVIFFTGVWTMGWLVLIWLNAQHSFLMIEGQYYVDRIAFYGACFGLITVGLLLYVNLVKKVLGIKPAYWSIRF